LQSNAGVSAWAPLREPLFRSLWIAAIISYIGTWMQAVGAGWMMTQISGSPLMVGLVQAAVALPVFLVILPAARWLTWWTGDGSAGNPGLDGAGVGRVGCV